MVLQSPVYNSILYYDLFSRARELGAKGSEARFGALVLLGASGVARVEKF